MEEKTAQELEDIFADDDDFKVERKIQQLENEAILVELPDNIRYDDIIGNTVVRDELIQVMKHTDPDQPKRLMLYGAVGVGKSFLMKGVAKRILHETASAFYSIQSCSLMSRWLNSSGRIKDIFRVAHETRPSTIFMDDLDSLFGGLGPNTSEQSQTLLNEFTQCIQEIDTDTCVLAAAAHPWTLHKEILDSFDKFIYIPLPDHPTRMALFKKLFLCCTNSLESPDYSIMADRTVGYSHSDIVVACKQAMMKPWIRVQSATHFCRTNGPILDNPDIFSDNLLTPCPPDSPDSIEISFTEIDDEELLPPSLTMVDINLTLDMCKASMEAAYLKLTEDFSLQLN